MSELDLGLDMPSPPPEGPKDGVVWSKYRPQKPVHCDRCVAEVHANWPHNTKAPNRAVCRRREAGVDTYWCSLHADPRRREDGK